MLRSLLAIAAVATVGLATSSAHAEDAGPSLNWNKLYPAAESVMRGQFTQEAQTTQRTESRPSPEGLGGAWFGVDPHVSVVARDWGEGYRLYGAPMALSDQLRLSRSYRMIVSRVRLGEGRIVPFVQAGVGQWRTDTSALPALRYDVELAAQFGWGVEAHVRHNLDLVVETNTTWIIRDARDPGSVPDTHINGGLFFARATF